MVRYWSFANYLYFKWKIAFFNQSVFILISYNIFYILPFLLKKKNSFKLKFILRKFPSCFKNFCSQIFSTKTRTIFVSTKLERHGKTLNHHNSITILPHDSVKLTRNCNETRWGVLKMFVFWKINFDSLIAYFCDRFHLNFVCHTNREVALKLFSYLPVACCCCRHRGGKSTIIWHPFVSKTHIFVVYIYIHVLHAPQRAMLAYLKSYSTVQDATFKNP